MNALYHAKELLYAMQRGALPSELDALTASFKQSLGLWGSISHLPIETQMAVLVAAAVVKSQEHS